MLQNIVDICGWLGGLGYAIFAIPQAISVIIQGHAKSLNIYFLILMWIGALFSLIYIWPYQNMPLIVNFSLSILTSSIMIKYKIFTRKK